MNKNVELFLKPIVWLLWILVVAVLCIGGICGFIWLEITFWKWNWTIATVAHVIISYLIAVVCCEDQKWPWKEI